MLKLKLEYFGNLMRRTNSLEKTLMLGRIEGRKRRGRQRIRWLVLGSRAMTNLDSILKRHYFAHKGPPRQSYGFSRSHAWM